MIDALVQAKTGACPCSLSYAVTGRQPIAGDQEASHQAYGSAGFSEALGGTYQLAWLPGPIFQRASNTLTHVLGWRSDDAGGCKRVCGLSLRRRRQAAGSTWVKVERSRQKNGESEGRSRCPGANAWCRGPGAS
jgi:hypothetical protein